MKIESKSFSPFFFFIGVWQIVFLHRKETLTRRKSLKAQAQERKKEKKRKHWMNVFASFPDCEK